MAAMLVRNAVLLAILAPLAVRSVVGAFALMFIVCITLAFVHHQPAGCLAVEPDTPILNITSPFSLKSALKFGLVIIQVAGILGQQTLGQFGVYVTSLLGGLFSSSSAVAAAAALATHDTIPVDVAGVCAVIASLTSVVVNLPLVMGVGDRRLISRLAWTVGMVTVVGIVGTMGQAMVSSLW
jgi:uncharacterized membrane protein (DUF4010 family)